MADQTALSDFDALMSLPTTAKADPADLDALLQAPAVAAATPGEQAPVNKGKAKLNAENQALTAQVGKMQSLIKVLVAVVGALVFVVLGLILYNRGTEKVAFRRAFEVLHYREKRTLQANAVVLSEYTENLGKIQSDVRGLPGITEEERATRLRAMETTVSQAQNLKDGFIKMIKDNDRERGKGSTFEYRDPFLKRPINFDAEMGGEVSLEKLRDEVKAAAKMDEAMKELRAVMLNPVPIADQMKVEAKRQDAPLLDENGRDLPRAMPQPPGALPGPGQASPTLRLPGLPRPGGSPQ